MRVGFALFLIVFAALFVVVVGGFGDAQNDYRLADTATHSRRPDPRLWQLDTASWDVGAAVASARDFPDYNKPDPALANIAREDSKSDLTSGSAYAVGPGVWLTARHVVDHCRTVTVEGGDPSAGEYRLPAEHIYLSPDADAAVIRTTADGAAPEPVTLAPEDQDGTEAIEIGFPQGKPGAVYSRFMGRTTLRWIGASPMQSDTIAWAEVSRVPNFGAEIGGLSGGLAMNPYGVAIGIVSAGSPRRGRILTTQPSDLWRAIRGDDAKVSITGKRQAIRITDKSYPVVARDMIQDRRVARVICEVARGSISTKRNLAGR